MFQRKFPPPGFSPGSCPKAPASPPVLFVNEYQKPPVLPRFSSQMPPVLPRFFRAPPVLPRFPPGSPPLLPTLYANRKNKYTIYGFLRQSQGGKGYQRDRLRRNFLELFLPSKHSKTRETRTFKKAPTFWRFLCALLQGVALSCDHLSFGRT